MSIILNDFLVPHPCISGYSDYQGQTVGSLRHGLLDERKKGVKLYLSIYSCH